MAVSSVNISGLPAALTCDEAVDQLGASVSVYLDGGRVGADGQPSSTIVDFTQVDHGQILRRGALGLAVLAETLPEIEDLVDDEDDAVDEIDEDHEGDEPADGDEPAEDDLESADRIRAEIEGIGQPEPEPDGAAGDEPVEAETTEPAPAGVPAPADEPWHEPTTDELRITHPDHDVDQPDLFETSDDGVDRNSADSDTTPDPRT
jgi:hypothetical protein